MASGPSPLVPFLLVATLGLLLHGRSLMEGVQLISDAEDTTLTLLLVFPLIAFLLVYFTTQSVILPLAIMLIIYAVCKMFLGPLVLMLLIYFLTVYVPSLDSFQGYSYRSSQVYNERDRDVYGWGFVVFLLTFFALHGMLSEGGYQWGLVFLTVLFFILYNFQNLG